MLCGVHAYRCNNSWKLGSGDVSVFGGRLYALWGAAAWEGACLSLLSKGGWRDAGQASSSCRLAVLDTDQGYLGGVENRMSEDEDENEGVDVGV